MDKSTPFSMGLLHRSGDIAMVVHTCRPVVCGISCLERARGERTRIHNFIGFESRCQLLMERNYEIQ